MIGKIREDWDEIPWNTEDWSREIWGRHWAIF